MANLQANRTLSGSFAEVWVDGARIAELTQRSFREQLWQHRPLTDFWRVGKGYAKKLEVRGIYTMGDIARVSLHSEELLYELFGVNAELLIDHAWGWEPCTIADIKAYKPQSSSVGSGQVLHHPYSFDKARLIVREMTERLVLDLVEHHLVTDQMVLTVKDLMEERYRDQIAIAESQMKSLQAQIKPHFLYNTLDTIKWMILGQKTEDAAWMVNALSRYLRQSINKGPSIIPLREELELSRTYLEIMQKRFENRFTVNFEIEDAAADYMIPKLSLQPLLENALLHGILYCEKPEKELTVRAWAGKDSVHIEVEDNGNGMPEETRQKLEKGSIGYGLTNVRKRLSLFGMEKSEFQIFSREGVGTCIAIRIPAVQPEQAKQTT